MSGVTFGQWIGAAIVVAVGVGVIEAYNARWAYGVAVLILLALFLRYPNSVREIRRIFPGQYAGGSVGGTF